MIQYKKVQFKNGQSEKDKNKIIKIKKMGSLDGRGVLERWIHVHVCLSPFVAYVKLSQYCLLISYTPKQNKKYSKSVKT